MTATRYARSAIALHWAIALLLLFQLGLGWHMTSMGKGAAMYAAFQFHKSIGILILLLSVADAFLTLTLITGGANEANPLLAFVLREHPQMFAGLKMALTGTGLLVLVAVARARLFRVLKVGVVLQGIFVAYVALIAYEWWLLREFL